MTISSAASSTQGMLTRASATQSRSNPCARTPGSAAGVMGKWLIPLVWDIQAFLRLKNDASKASVARAERGVKIEEMRNVECRFPHGTLGIGSAIESGIRLSRV